MSDPPARPAASGETFSPQLVPGARVFDRYVLEALVGKGGMGVVWRAHDDALSETVALKFLPESVANDAVAVDDLKVETRRARRLTHPHIVRIHDFAQDATLAAVSMEFVDGATLTQLRLRQPGRVFDSTTLAPLVAQLCAALHYAHATAKIVHRDIKPANILVTKEGQLKVTDFGIARSLTETRTRLTSMDGADTSGTLPYMSPQQLRGDKSQASDDIYALGATLYELLVGKPPFFRGDVHSLRMQIQEKAPQPLEAQRSEMGLPPEVLAAAAPIPVRWETTILACLAKQPQDRPQSAKAVAELLGLAMTPAARSAAPAESKEKSGAGPDRKSDPKKNRRLVYVAALATVAISGAWWFLRPQESTPPKLVAPSPATATTPKPPAPAVALRELVVTVEPAEAEARLWFGPLSDVAVKGGRAVLKDLPDGDFDLAVQAAGYEPLTMSKVAVRNGRGSVAVKLVAVTGGLEITARPGTRVQTIDAKGNATVAGTIGPKGSLVADSLPVGGYALRLEHPDCETLEVKDVTVGSGRVTRLTPRQIPLPGELRVTSSPADAEVRINGQPAGRTPLLAGKLPSEQTLHVEVALAGYRKVSQEVSLAPRETRAFDAGPLVAEVGGIALELANPNFPTANALVRVDGKRVTLQSAGSGWHLEGLAAGQRTLELEHPAYEKWTQAVSVPDGQTARVTVGPVPKPGAIKFAVTGPKEFRVLVNGQEVPVVNDRAAVPAEIPLIVEIRAPNFRPGGGRMKVSANAEMRLQGALEPQPLPKPGQPHTNTLHMKFVPVPGTTALFSIWETRVTDYAVFLYATKQHPRAEPSGRITEPAVELTWDDAKDFCRWLTETERAEGNLAPGQSYRLPTDAEWSLAVGLGQETGNSPALKDHKTPGVFPWGTQWPPPPGAGNYAGAESESSQSLPGYRDGFARTAPVGSFTPNRLGIFDLGGNVWEWCEETFTPMGSERVMRGGSFNDSDRGLLGSSSRNRANPRELHSDVGFRCVLDPGAAP